MCSKKEKEKIIKDFKRNQSELHRDHVDEQMERPWYQREPQYQKDKRRYKRW